MAILGPLRALDPVAYLRFASVYKAFSSPDDFEDEIALLRMEQDAAAPSVVEPGEGRTPLVEERALRASRNQGAQDAPPAVVRTG